jgi:hypothetical protein
VHDQAACSTRIERRIHGPLFEFSRLGQFLKTVDSLNLDANRWAALLPEEKGALRPLGEGLPGRLEKGLAGVAGAVGLGWAKTLLAREWTGVRLLAFLSRAASDEAWEPLSGVTEAREGVSATTCRGT